MGGREKGARFSVTYTARAKRQLKQLLKKSDQILKHRFLEKANSLAQDPTSGKSLKGWLKGQFSLRFRDYRIIYEVDKTKREVIVTDVGHRKGVYDRSS